MPDESVTPLDVQYASRRALLLAAKSERGALSLFVPTSRVVLQDALVRLRISLADASERFDLQGRAASGKRPGRSGTGGFLAVFTGEDKRRAAEMIAFCAQRPLSMGTASRERIPLRKGCLLKQEELELPAELRDLSQTGAFVVGRQFSRLKADEPVWLKVTDGLFGLGGTWLEARVVWQGKKAEERGLGLRFTGNESRQALAIQRLLERAASEQG
jgi:hypothetical protein